MFIPNDDNNNTVFILSFKARGFLKVHVQDCKSCMKQLGGGGYLNIGSYLKIIPSNLGSVFQSSIVDHNNS